MPPRPNRRARPSACAMPPASSCTQYVNSQPKSLPLPSRPTTAPMCSVPMTMRISRMPASMSFFTGWKIMGSRPTGKKVLVRDLRERKEARARAAREHDAAQLGHAQLSWRARGVTASAPRRARRTDARSSRGRRRCAHGRPTGRSRGTTPPSRPGRSRTCDGAATRARRGSSSSSWRSADRDRGRSATWRTRSRRRPAQLEDRADDVQVRCARSRRPRCGASPETPPAVEHERRSPREWSSTWIQSRTCRPSP